MEGLTMATGTPTRTPWHEHTAYWLGMIEARMRILLDPARYGVSPDEAAQLAREALAELEAAK
jgi:hypothetical protein